MKRISWCEYYDGFYDWSFETQKKYADYLEDYGSADEVFEVLEELVFSDEAFASRLAKRALDAGVRFSPEQVLEMALYLDRPVLNRMAETASEPFDREQMEELEGNIGDDVLRRLSVKSGVEFYNENGGRDRDYEKNKWTKKETVPDRYLMDQVVDIHFLDVHHRLGHAYVGFAEVYGNGRKKTRNVKVTNLPGYYKFLTPKPITHAEFLGKVYTGMFRGTVCLLFAVKLADGTAELIHSYEGSKESLQLLEMSMY